MCMWLFLGYEVCIFGIYVPFLLWKIDIYIMSVFFIFELWLLFNVVMDITKWCSGVIGVWKKYNQLERKKVSDIFRNYVHNVVMDITNWWFVVICYRIIRGYASNCFMVWGRHFLVFMCPFFAMKDWYIHNVCSFLFLGYDYFNVVMDITKWCFWCYHTQICQWVCIYICFYDRR